MFYKIKQASGESLSCPSLSLRHGKPIRLLSEKITQNSLPCYVIMLQIFIVSLALHCPDVMVCPSHIGYIYCKYVQLLNFYCFFLRVNVNFFCTCTCKLLVLTCISLWNTHTIISFGSNYWNQAVVHQRTLLHWLTLKEVVQNPVTSTCLWVTCSDSKTEHTQEELMCIKSVARRKPHEQVIKEYC